MAPTAYMLFCNAHREPVRKKLLDEGHEKVAVTVLAKALGQLWKSLSDDERAAYKAQADQQQQQQQQQSLHQLQGEPDGEENSQHGPQDVEKQSDTATDPRATTLPVAWVRRVIALDPDIKRCSADALLALSGAADVFLAAVCAKATTAATGAKRRTVRLDDVERSVRADKRLSATGFMAVVSMVAVAAAATAEDGKTGQPGKKAKLDKVVAGKANNSIERAFGLAPLEQA